MKKLTLSSMLTILATWLFVFYENALRTSDSVIVPQLMREFHVAAGGIGIISSTAYIAYIVFLIPAGLLLDRFLLKYVLSAALLSVSVGSLLFSMSHTMAVAVLAQVLMGLGSPVAFVACVKVVEEIFSGKNLSFWIGIIMTVITLGAVAGQVPFAWWVDRLDIWRSAYSVSGFLGVCLTIFTWMACRDFSFTRTIDKIGKMPAIKIIKQQKFRLLALYIALLSAPITAFAALWAIPFMIQAWHMPVGTAAALVAMAWIGGLFGGPLLGFIADYFHIRRALLITVGLLAALIVLVLLFIPLKSIIGIALLLFVLGVLCNANVVVFAIMAESVPANQVGLVTAATTIFDMGGGPFFQLIIAWLLGLGSHVVLNGVATYSLKDYQWALILIPIMLAVASLSLVRLPNNTTS